MAAGDSSRYVEILDRNKLVIVKGLRDVDAVVKITDTLISDGTLHPRAKREIQAKETRAQKILVLINCLKQGLTIASFGSFLQCLQSTGYGDLAEHIRRA